MNKEEEWKKRRSEFANRANFNSSIY